MLESSLDFMISIVGAGPAGSYAAYLLAKNGQEVNIYEAQNKIGEPVQCTGIVTSSIAKYIQPHSSFLINTIKKTRIYSKNNMVEVKLNDNLILNRAKFDQYLAKRAEKAGARVYKNHRFIDFKQGKMKFYGKKKAIKTDILIGADGPSSQVARSTGLWSNRSFFVGAQVQAKLKNDNVVEFYIGKGDFAWIVPESRSIARIGIIARDKPALHFKSFLDSKLGEDHKDNIISTQGGLVPLYNPKQQTQKKNVFLVGDAATTAKATTAGGIIQGLIGAEALADSIEYNIDYEKEWRSRMGKDLYLSLLIRKMMDKFSIKDYNRLIRYTKNPRVIDLLEKYDRDYPSQLLFRLLLSEPRYAYFSKFLF